MIGYWSAFRSIFTKILKTVIPGNRYITGIHRDSHEIAAFETV